MPIVLRGLEVVRAKTRYSVINFGAFLSTQHHSQTHPGSDSLDETTSGGPARLFLVLGQLSSLSRAQVGRLCGCEVGLMCARLCLFVGLCVMPVPISVPVRVHTIISR